MKAICLIDTTILLAFLGVPGKSDKTNTQAVGKVFEEKNNAGEKFFLPQATIIETGNHIGQVADGNTRRNLATTFSKLVIQSLDGISPFTVTRFWDKETLLKLMEAFSDSASQEIGLGDASIIRDWEQQKELNAARRVYLWSGFTSLWL